MFRRNWCGLPREVYFPSGLKELGYFVNDEDEIRSIANPNYYFNHFLDKNPRVNLRQRTQFQSAIQGIVHDRLETLGLRKTPLPPVERGSEAKYVSIFVSENIKSAERIIVVFGECPKELGMVASRIASGPGGINKGTMVGAVKAMQRHESAGIVLANMGESYWSQEHNRAITVSESAAQSMPSLVHMGIKYDAKVNDIPGSESPVCHARTVLETTITQYANKDAKIDIIAIGDSCEVITTLLDEEKTWTKWSASLQGALFYSPAFYHEHKQESLKCFFTKKARGYVVSEQPLGTPLSGPEGSVASRVPPLGFPCYSSGEPCIDELCFITALEDGLSYLDEIERTPNYENPVVLVVEPDSEQATAEEAERAWDALPPEQRPSLTTVDAAKLQKELKCLRRMKVFEQTGYALGNEEDEEFDMEETAGSKLPVKPW